MKKSCQAKYFLYVLSMPTYDYACLDCGHIFEKFHSMSENPTYTCEKCKSTNVQKKIGAGSGIIFKGSGFYVNDYKKNKTPPDRSSESPKSSKPSKTTAPKT